MFRQFIPVFTTDIKRYYSISSIHYDSIDPGEEFQIAFDCDEPLPLNWPDLLDDDHLTTSDASSMGNLFNKNGHT
ncbi:unnamed protein product, partial [Rotaria sp. Silwood1]